MPEATSAAAKSPTINPLSPESRNESIASVPGSSITVEIMALASR
jgi:hypothetical protein